MDPNFALVYGSKEPQLCLKTMKTLIDDQAERYGDRTAVVFPWQSIRLSYRQLADRSKVLAKAMIEMGLGHGDCIGIMAGNCYQYIEVFLGGARIGCPVVVLNNTYTPSELANAVRRSCKFIRFDFLFLGLAH
jgi:acyl-CoA synthetase (AMP-forming)/AMP-acid ligase II